MVTNKKQLDQAPEISAISSVYNALKALDPSAQMRVLRYSAEMLGLSAETVGSGVRRPQDQDVDQGAETVLPAPGPMLDSQGTDDAEGISPVALKWMRRSGLDPKSLQKLFSLGIDEIDLVASKIPGSSKKDRMRSVLLLKGIATYLGTGVPRVSYEHLKEACLHYDAYDAGNFAAYIKSFAAEVTGSKELGYTLSARGLTSGTEIVKKMLESSSER
jgi:hypothetical protein